MVAESVFVTAAVVAVVEFLKRVKDQDWIPAVTIVAAAVIGTLAGVAEIEGLTPMTGFIAGLAASGAYTVAGKVASS